MTAEIIEPVIRPDNLQSPLDYLTQAAFDVQKGRVEAVELATAMREPTDHGTYHLISVLESTYGNPNGVAMTEAAVKQALPVFINTLTGPSPDPAKPLSSGFEMINEIVNREEPDHSDMTFPDYTTNFWEIPTLQDNVLLGVKVVFDESGEFGRTWYLTNIPAAQREPFTKQLGRRFRDLFRYHPKESAR
jgi:hypothetical protein